MLKRETFVGAIRAIQKQEEMTEQINRIYKQMTDGDSDAKRQADRTMERYMKSNGRDD